MAAQDNGGSTVQDLKPVPTKQRLEPPPESASVQWTRRWIIFSFWAVVVLLGLPHWIWTTSTYRAALPLERMNEWDQGKACQLRYPLDIRLNMTGPKGNITEFESQTRRMLDQISSVHEYRVGLARPQEEMSDTSVQAADLIVNLDVKEASNPHDHTATLRSSAPVLDVKQGITSIGDVIHWAPQYIKSAYEDEEASLYSLLSGTPFAKDGPSPVEPEKQRQLDARSTRAFKYASTYHLTFSLFTSGSSPSAWEIDQALEQYIQPLVSSLSSISAFTIDTQVQLHAAFSPSIAGPLYDPASKDWKLQKSDLSGFINAAEWPLSPSIGAGPTINFVLYVPSKEQSPLSIAETGGTSWLIPQWGGVQILNPSGKQPSILSVTNLEPAMLTFAEQLTALVGLPPAPSSLAIRLQSLTRERTTSLILHTSSTLGALSRLTLKLTSIAIPNSVAASVTSTLHHLDAACSSLSDGRYDEALRNARVANDEAERAFFEPSMVGQVYFPDEHKVAVYVPLLGPMAVPLVMAVVKEVKTWRERRKAKVA